MQYKLLISALLLSGLLSACASTQDDGVTDSNLTVGVVQKEIAEGMDAVDVLRVLGSPNIVKKAPDSGETGIYDKC